MKSREHASIPIRRSHGTHRRVPAIAGIGAVAAILASNAMAQVENAKALAERSTIVMEGKVLRVNASLEPMQAASPLTVVVEVSRMYAGAEIAGDQTGRTATVILSGRSESIKAGATALFFGNPRFIGNFLTVADEGELLADAASAATADLESARGDRQLRDRIASANSIFRGKVESEHALATGDAQLENLREPASEHDPQWHVAAVRVLTALRGNKEGELVSVIFPASDDIMWFNAPKLKEGQEAIFIAHGPDRDGARLTAAPGVATFLDKQPAVVVSQPFDTVPASDEARVRALLAKGN
jgi:hypothetical protein